MTMIPTSDDLKRYSAPPPYTWAQRIFDALCLVAATAVGVFAMYCILSLVKA